MADNQLYAYEHIESARKRRDMNGPNSAQKGTKERASRMNKFLPACLPTLMKGTATAAWNYFYCCVCVREFIRHEKRELI